MNWLPEDKEAWLARIPGSLRRAHDHCTRNRAEVLASDWCRCFYCLGRFKTGDIEEWVDETEGDQQTAVCPLCGIDSVLGDAAGLDLSDEFLNQMNTFWFSAAEFPAQ